MKTLKCIAEGDTHTKVRVAAALRSVRMQDIVKLAVEEWLERNDVQALPQPSNESAAPSNGHSKPAPEEPEDDLPF